jgi:hypothetical protein
MSLRIVVTNSKKQVSQKNTISGNEHDRTIKRTINGEAADLQIKFVLEGNHWNMVHVHCMKCKATSEWKRSSGQSLSDKYLCENIGNGIFKITCKSCWRVWRN